MLPDGTLETWDMRFAMAFRSLDLDQPEGTSYPGAPRQKRLASANIVQAMEFVDESLAQYQGYWKPIDIDTNPLNPHIQLPFATYLDVGDEFTCIDTGLVYTVEDVLRDGDGNKTGEVRLEGAGPLDIWHRLIPEHRLVFKHAYPKSLAQPYKFDDDTNLEQVDKPWTDHITWLLIRREPGSLGRQPFGDPREQKPRHREFVIDSRVDCDYAQQISGQQFDNIVQFDIWAQTNKRASLLIEWFHDFLIKHVWVWKLNGVKDVYYWQQTADALVTKWRNDIVNRTVQWYVQTERLSHTSIRRLREVDVSVDVLIHGEDFAAPTVTVDPSGCVDPTARILFEIVDGPGEIF
jgi:hypothetical protein